MYPLQDTVRCGFWVGLVVDRYIFKNEVYNAITVNGLRCVNMLSDFLWPGLDGRDVDGICFNKMVECVTLRPKQCSY